MLYLIPRPVHIVALRTVHFIRLRWWRWSGARVTGCRVVVLDDTDRVLLIRHSYGSRGWMLPGGGLKRCEDARAAAAREVMEEAGLQLSGIVEVGFVSDVLHGAVHEVRIVAGWTGDSPLPDGREVIEARFFALDSLPQAMSPKLVGALPGYVTAAKAARPLAD